MRVHAIQTGTVQVHERQRRGAGHGPLRTLGTLLDTEWSEPMPILAWLIEHPEGLIVVDTGETARALQPGYFPRWHPYYRLALRLQVTPDQEIGPRLQQIGFSPADVRWVVITHLHTDHAGGLGWFTKSEILISRTEYETARGLIGKMRGYLPHRLPAGMSPTLVDFRAEPTGPFPDSCLLTAAGDVRLVSTTGHSAGHLSVTVDEGEQVLFIAGDTSYDEAALIAGTIDGVVAMGGGEAAAATAQRRIRDFARQRRLVYLPTHDAAAPRRLEERQPVTIGAEPA